MYNTIIIGAGPAGMASALYLKRSGIKTLIIDKNVPGGQITETNIIENYLGIDSINGADLALKMFNQIKKIDVEYVYGEVVSIEKKDNFIVKTNEKEYKCKNIIIAVGKTHNKLGLENENIKGISYCAVCDGAFYKEKTVMVVGAGNSAYTQAIYLSSLANKVYIVNRSENIKADKGLIEKAQNKENIIYLSNAKITKINGNNKLESIIINDKIKIDTDGLFIAIGGKPNINFIKEIKEENNYIIVNKKMQTNIKGIYAVGDVIKKDYYQIATAINDGVIAALTIKESE